MLQLGFGTDEKVSGELKKNIMQARLDKKFTQAQLAQVCLVIPTRCSSILCFFSIHSASLGSNDVDDNGQYVG